MELTNQSTYDILKDSILSKPRMMGTKGEKETTEFLLDFLMKNKLSPFTEEVRWTTAMLNGRKILFMFLGGFICLLNLFLWLLAPPINGIVSLSVALFSFLFVVLFFLGILNDKLQFLGKESKGKNVICEIEPEKPTEKSTIIYLVAHSDSISTNLPKFRYQFMFIMLFGFLFEVLLTISSSIISLVIYYQNALTTNLAISVINIITLVIGIIVVIIVIIGLFVIPINASPGACDNGSGCAILLSLAVYFKNYSLKNTQLKFVWCTAEEWGIYGSKGYVKAHKEEIIANKENSFVVNFDMVGSELAYLGKTGLIRKKEINTQLNKIIEETAKECNITARKFNSWMAGNTDMAPFMKEKIEASSFTSLKDHKNIHSPKDSIENVQPEKLDDAVQLLSKVIEKLDSGNNK
ncbi:MAG: M28 family metallopeptidase [Candidatus Heimdallarchaeota archaeon]